MLTFQKRGYAVEKKSFVHNILCLNKHCMALNNCINKIITGIDNRWEVSLRMSFFPNQYAIAT